MNEYESHWQHERALAERLRTWMPFVVAMCIGLLIVSALLIEKVGVPWTTGVFIGVLVALAALIRPEWALIAVTVLAPLEIYTYRMGTLIPGTGLTPVNAVALLLIASTLAQVFSINKPSAPATGLDKPLMTYLLWSFISVFIGIMLWTLDAAGIGEWVSMFCGYSTYWVVRRRWHSQKLAYLGVLVVLLMVGFEAVMVMNQYNNSNHEHFDWALKRAITGTFPEGNSNDIGTYLSTYAMIGLGFFFGKKVGIWRWLGLAVFALAGAATFCTYSRAAYWALMVGFMVIVLYKHKRYVVPAMVLLMVLPNFLPGSINSRLNEKGDVSAESRKDMWRNGMQIMINNPIGIGWRGYEKHEAARHQVLRDPHSMYVLVAAEQGIIGLGLFLGMLIIAGREIIRAVKRARNPFTQALGVGVFGALVAMCVDSIFGSRMVWYYSVEHFWFLVGILMVLTRPPAPGEPVPVEVVAEDREKVTSPWRYKSYV